jgi:hypothetical protein
VSCHLKIIQYALPLHCQLLHKLVVQFPGQIVRTNCSNPQPLQGLSGAQVVIHSQVASQKTRGVNVQNMRICQCLYYLLVLLHPQARTVRLTLGLRRRICPPVPNVFLHAHAPRHKKAIDEQSMCMAMLASASRSRDQVFSCSLEPTSITIQ